MRRIVKASRRPPIRAMMATGCISDLYESLLTQLGIMQAFNCHRGLGSVRVPAPPGGFERHSGNISLSRATGILFVPAELRATFSTARRHENSFTCPTKARDTTNEARNHRELILRISI